MFLVLVVTSETQISHDFPASAEKIDSKVILSKSGFKSKLEPYGRRLMRGSGTQRVSSGVPHPLNHSLPPALS